MNRPIAIASGAILLAISSAVAAGPREEIIAHYAAQAPHAAAGFDGFSPERGQMLHTSKFTGGKPGTPAGTS